MKTETAVTLLADYQPPAYRILETALEFDLDAHQTKVHATHRVEKIGDACELILHAEELKIISVSINGKKLTAKEYKFNCQQLVIFNPPSHFELEIENTIAPNKNTALSGLYKSTAMLCTQCEAQGFRRITPALDRPDNLSVYRVTLRGDKKTMPCLLSNGNLVERGDLEDQRHFATWHDPFPKPTYLFALVAGDLDCYADTFTTVSGRKVALKFYAKPRDMKKCAHALAALKRAMAWDEKVYGREYDLDIFNVVAVDDFNMGAMENKSLNIFNTKYVLAAPDLATDADFENVEAVVAHEYFHNWSGNRVTCRDWFQLSLKEGFTVFREQQFCADSKLTTCDRISDVALLRSVQFSEDAGPMAHAVRPDSYLEINNFYTATVYNKGAEVVRMLRTILGADDFRRATDLYFARHDGQAVTTDDFVAAMESVSGLDLGAFKNWYSQAGTPVVSAQTKYDQANEIFSITLAQSCAPTPGQNAKEPFVIPLRAGLFDRSGNRIAAKLDAGKNSDTDHILILSAREQTFNLSGVKQKPIASLLRDFSAPIKLHQRLSTEELAILFAHDDDEFNRWEAGQKLLLSFLLPRIVAISENKITLSEKLEDADSDEILTAITTSIATMLDDATDPAAQAKLFTLPSPNYLGELSSPIDPRAIFQAREDLNKYLAVHLQDKLIKKYQQCNEKNDGTVNPQQIGWRALRDACIVCLSALRAPEIDALAVALLQDAKCMTDMQTALWVIARSNLNNRTNLLEDFYQRYKDEPLAVNKWFSIQAGVPAKDTLSRVQALTCHRAFDSTNPNNVYALLLSFSHANPLGFHREDGAGYSFICDWVERLDTLNPQVSARLVSAFNRWKNYIPHQREQMKNILDKLHNAKLSNDVSEIVDKSLQTD